ncbi:MAG: phage tail assembly chaperone [Hyphomonadaceae bacterium]
MAIEPTPWPALLAQALRLGLAPAAFWRLSLLEWRALTRQGAPARLARAEFEALAARFPDDKR